MRFMMKFGGVCLSNCEGIKRAAEIIKEYCDSGNGLVVVTSAYTNLTDQLIEIASKAKMKEMTLIPEFTSKLEATFLNLADELVKNKQLLRELKEEIRKEISDLHHVLSGVTYLGELTPRTKDLVLSYGEALPAVLLNKLLLSMGVNTQLFTKGDAGIVTDENFGNANPLIKMTAQKVKSRLHLMDEGIIPVVAGFIAETQKGVITTLGRGGSDYTATLIGSSLDIDEIVIWTDVDGFMTADPKIEPEAVKIDNISYEEASEMIYFGAKSMHPKAFEPAVQAKKNNQNTKSL